MQRPEQQSQPFWHQALVACKSFSIDGARVGLVLNYSGAVHLLCILFLFLFHQLHVRSSGAGSQRSETRGLEHLLWFLQEETGVPQTPGLAGMDSSGESRGRGVALAVGTGPKLVRAGGRWPSPGEPDGEGGDGSRRAPHRWPRV